MIASDILVALWRFVSIVMLHITVFVFSAALAVAIEVQTVQAVLC